MVVRHIRQKQEDAKEAAETEILLRSMGLLPSEDRRKAPDFFTDPKVAELAKRRGTAIARGSTPLLQKGLT